MPKDNWKKPGLGQMRKWKLQREHEELRQAAYDGKVDRFIETAELKRRHRVAKKRRKKKVRKEKRAAARLLSPKVLTPEEQHLDSIAQEIFP